MKTVATRRDVLVVATSAEGRVGVVQVSSISEGGQVIGRLTLATKEVAPRAVALFEAADEASECLNFSLMELEEANLAAEGLRIELPDGSWWRLGVDIGELLVTERCRHVAFKLLSHSKQCD